MMSACSISLYKPIPIEYSVNKKNLPQVTRVKFFVDFYRVAFEKNHQENIELNFSQLQSSFKKDNYYSQFGFVGSIDSLKIDDEEGVGRIEYLTSTNDELVYFINSIVIRQEPRPTYTVSENKGARKETYQVYEKEKKFQINDRLTVIVNFDLINPKNKEVVRSGQVIEKSTIVGFLDEDELKYGYSSMFRRLMWSLYQN